VTRLFVAVLPPEHVLDDLEAYVGPRRGQAPFRWTLPEQWHLTLAFMADAPERVLDELVERLERAARKRRPMQLGIAGGGAFPNPARARVLYADLDAAEDDREELRRLATGARAAASRAGAPVDGQRFRPHLTLARLGRPLEATGWVRLLDAYRGPSWTVEEVALVASPLGEGPRGRARHEVVETFRIGRAGSGPAPADAPPRGR
jgi:2'-5' RNA ligase